MSTPCEASHVEDPGAQVADVINVGVDDGVYNKHVAAVTSCRTVDKIRLSILILTKCRGKRACRYQFSCTNKKKRLSLHVFFIMRIKKIFDNHFLKN